MARTLTGLSPRREQRQQSIMLDRLVIAQQPRIRAEIARAMRQYAKMVRDQQAGAAYLVRAEHDERMGRIIKRTWTATALVFAKHMTQNLPKAAALIMQRKDFGAPRQLIPTQVANALVADFALTEGSQLIKMITATTMADIQRLVNRGFEEGMSELELADLIRQAAPIKSASRAQTIARTETHRAAAKAAQTIAVESGVNMRRRWVSAAGERTREDHSAADGQTVGMFEPFIIGGEQLMEPGDPSASPHQTINCRCCVAYVLE